MSDRREAERKALTRAFADYRRLQAQDAERLEGERMDLPDLALVAVRCRTEEVDLTAAVNRVRDGVNAGQGWARLRSGLALAGEYPENLGEPLYADWATGGSASCRLRVLSGGATYRARVWTFAERELKPEDALHADEIPALREVRRMPAQGLGGHILALVHHVYWAAAPHEDVHALARRFDRFAGFETRSAL